MSAARKVVIVTGATQGIGADLVKGYRDRNYRIIANSRSIKPSSDADVLNVAGDIADPATAERIVSQGLDRFGRIDTLVNNAGIFIAKPFIDYTEEDYASIVASQSRRLLPNHQARSCGDGEAGFGAHRADHDQPGSSPQQQRSFGARRAYQGVGSMPRRDLSRSNMPHAGSGSTPSRQASSRHQCIRWKRTNSCRSCILLAGWQRSATLLVRFYTSRAHLS